MDDETTPQFATLDWLDGQDPADLDFDTLSDRDLYQRYISALLYFSTDGENWDDDFGFLRETSVCSWRKSNGVGGIICDDAGSISKIMIGEDDEIVHWLAACIKFLCLFTDIASDLDWIGLFH